MLLMSRRQSGSFHFCLKEYYGKDYRLLGEQERSALNQLAQREMRVPRAQAALIIRQELVRQEMLPEKIKAQDAELPLEVEIEGNHDELATSPDYML